MNKLKLLFKRPEHISKSFFGFVWFTIISFLIGMAVKIYVIETAGEGLTNIMSIKGSEMHTATGGIVKKNEVLIEDLSMLILQILIVLLTLWVYPKSIFDQLKVMSSPEGKMSRKMYRSFKREYIIFLSIFLFLDVVSIGTLFYEKAQIGFPMTFQIWFTIISIVIPTPLAIGSLVWLRKLRLSGHVEESSIETVKAKKAKVRA